MDGEGRAYSLNNRGRSKAPIVRIRYTWTMFGIRVLIYLLGIGLVIWILFRLAKGPRIGKKPARLADDMVRCARCGMFVPRQEALKDNERHYCCSQHRDEDR